MYCPHCGFLNTAAQDSCADCGNDLKSRKTGPTFRGPDTSRPDTGETSGPRRVVGKLKAKFEGGPKGKGDGGPKSKLDGGPKVIKKDSVDGGTDKDSRKKFDKKIISRRDRGEGEGPREPVAKRFVPQRHAPQETQDGEGQVPGGAPVFRPASIIKPASVTPQGDSAPHDPALGIRKAGTSRPEDSSPGRAAFQPAQPAPPPPAAAEKVVIPSPSQVEPPPPAPAPQKSMAIKFSGGTPAAAVEVSDEKVIIPSPEPEPEPEETKGPLKLRKPWELRPPGEEVEDETEKPSYNEQEEDAPGIHKPWAIPSPIIRDDDEEDEEEEKIDKGFVVLKIERNIDKDRGKIGTRALARQVVFSIIFFLICAILAYPVLRLFTRTEKELFLSGKVKKTNNPDLYIIRAKKYLDQRLFKLAQDDITQAMKLRKDFAEAYHQMARVHILSRGSIKKAFFALDTAIRFKQDPEFYMTRGNLALSQDMFKQCIADYSMIIALAPAKADGYFARGLAYLKFKQYSSALEDFAKGKETEPGRKVEADRYASATHYEMAMKDKEKRYLKGYLGHLNEALRLAPGHRDAQKELASYYFLRGERLMYQGKFNSAMNNANKAVEIQPDLEKGYYLRGDIYVRVGQREKAVKEFKRAFELEPTNSEFYRGLINTCFSIAKKAEAQNQKEKAIQYYDIIIGVDPKNATALVQRGGIFFQMGKYDKAAEDLESAISDNPSFSSHKKKLKDAYVGKGMTEFEAGKHQEAVETFGKALAINAKDARALVGRALAYYKLENFGKGDADMNKALQVNPNDPFVLVGKARQMIDMNRYDEGIGYCNRAINIREDYWEAYIYRGDANRLKKEIKKALPDWMKVSQNAKEGSYWQKAAKERLEKYTPTD
jgi:tetratricopeptide (TPR) repeat protein